MKKNGLILFLLLGFCTCALHAQTAAALVRKSKQTADPAQQVRLLSQAVKKAPQYAPAWHHRADAYLAQGKLKQAVADYSKAIALTPKDAFRYYARALAYIKQQKYTLALADLSKAISLKKNYPDFYLHRARTQMELKKYTAAIADYNKYLSHRKPSKEISLSLAQAYFHTYKYPQAQALLNALLEQDPQDFEPYFWYGRILYNQGRLDEAVSFYSKAIHRHNGYASAYRYRASAFKDMGELQAAADDYTQLLSLTPDPLFYNRRGLVYEEMNELEKALADYSKTIEISAKWPIAYNNRGYVYLKQKKYNSAKADFQTAIKLDASLPTPYINLAGAYWLHKKDRRNVYRHLEKALKRGFRDFDALYDENKKGWMFENINRTAEFRAIMYK